MNSSNVVFAAALALPFVLFAAPEEGARAEWAGSPEPSPYGPAASSVRQQAPPSGIDTVRVWDRPPMIMTGPMIPSLAELEPDVRPYRPDVVALDRLPPARSAESVRLEDGDTLVLEARPVRARIGDREVHMYGFNGQMPGPTLHVAEGGSAVVRLVNGSDLPTSLHWHGVRVPNESDGVTGLTQAPVAPGDTFTYELEFPDRGVFWYHPHHHQTIGQDLGLYGAIRVIPTDEPGRPPVDREEILLLDDLLVGESGVEPWGLEAPTHAFMGRFGNRLLVNGRTDYELEVGRGAVVRFHLVDAANTRMMNLRFGSGRLKVVGADLSRFEREERVGSVVIGPGQRYTVDVAFDEAGQVPITNHVQAVDHFRGQFYEKVDTLGFVRVQEEVASGHRSGFDSLRAAPRVQREIDRYREYFGRPVDRQLTIGTRIKGLPSPLPEMLAVDTMYTPPVEWNDVMPMMNWLSTGRTVRWYLYGGEPNPRSGELFPATGWRFDEGDVVKIRIYNDPRTPHPMHHPVHVHGQRFLVVERDGRPNDNLAWKDTVVIPVGSTVDLLVDMSNPGRWMINCQIPEHLESGMSMTFNVYPASPGS